MKKASLTLRVFSFLILTISTTAIAQKVSLDQFKNWKPRNIGPAGMSGRITTIDAVVENPNTIYVGAPQEEYGKQKMRVEAGNPYSKINQFLILDPSPFNNPTHP